MAALDAAQPELAARLPHVAPPASRCLLTDGRTPLQLALEGRHLCHAGVAIVARCGSTQVLLPPVRGTASCVEVFLPVARLPRTVEAGAVVWLEACLGGYLSPPVALFLTSDVHIAAEAARLSAALLASARSDAEACIETLLLSLAHTAPATAPAASAAGGCAEGAPPRAGVRPKSAKMPRLHDGGDLDESAASVASAEATAEHAGFALSAPAGHVRGTSAAVEAVRRALQVEVSSAPPRTPLEL